MKIISNVNVKKYFLILFLILLTLNSCTTKKKIIDDDFAVDSADAGLTNEDLTFDESVEEVSSDNPVSATDEDLALDSTNTAPDNSTTSSDEFSDFENDAAENKQEVAATDTDQNNTDDLDKELNQLSDQTATPPPVVELPPTELPATETPPVEIAQTEIPQTEVPPIEQTTQDPVVSVQPSAEVIAKVTQVQYKGNDSGGTIVITADQPIQYTTRINAENNQVIVEAENVIVSEALKRPLNTKDMSSSIGHIDIYQKKGSKTARFVIQLRANSPEPLVQPEGNSLLIVGSPSNVKSTTSLANSNSANSNSESTPDSASNFMNQVEDHTELNNEMNGKGIMGSDDLEAFLTNNNKFYGKKISIEAPDLDIREVLQFISEESGVNMVFDDKVEGKTTLKLRKVPWDQAFVTVLKSKQLSYRRQGSILRIAKQSDLITEDEAAIKLKDGKASVESLIVKNFSINYAKISDLKGKVEEVLKDTKVGANNRGKIIVDDSTGTLIITDTAKNLATATEVIKILDVQPQQVMIEAKVIEASETFTRDLNTRITLNSVGGTFPRPNGSVIPGLVGGRVGDTIANQAGQYISPQFQLGSGNKEKLGSGNIFSDIIFGSLGAFGNLGATLALNEVEGKIKIISSPRITVLSTKTAVIEQTARVVAGTISTAGTGGSPGGSSPILVDSGVKLTVTPNISSIGMIKLNLTVSRDSSTGGGGSGKRSATSEVMVKSGETAVIGGVFSSDVNTLKEGVPGLKDIPILGTLFKGQNNSNSKTELMIFVTPKIIPTLSTIFKADSQPAPEEKIGGDLEL